MKTAITSASVNCPLISPTKLETLSPPRFIRNPVSKIPILAQGSLSRSTFTVKCSENGQAGSRNMKDMVSGMVGDRVEQLLQKEENRGLLDGLEQATRRVEMARLELAEIEKQEAEAEIMKEYINKLESQAAEIAECQKEIMEARTMVEEAERALTDSPKTKGDSINKDEERLESAKAAIIAAIIGTLAELPISLTRATTYSELILPLAITFASCALFGVTFRYAIRKDLDDSHLKSGVYAAFGFVKGLGMLGGGSPLELEVGSIQSHAIDAAIYVSESFLVFLFAGVALDFCIKFGFLSTFPIDRSVPRT